MTEKIKDFNIVNCLNYYLLIINTDKGRAWIDENVSPDRTEFGRGLYVEGRYMADLVEGIKAAGLSI